jgi:hypothetical protein
MSYSRVEILDRPERRRRFSADEKRAILAEASEPGANVSVGKCAPDRMKTRPCTASWWLLTAHSGSAPLSRERRPFQSDGDTGHSYDTIFGPYMVGAKSIVVEDPHRAIVANDCNHVVGLQNSAEGGAADRGIVEGGCR